MSDAVSGIGAEFRRQNGSVFEKIAEVISISGPSMTRETIDVTNLDSTGGYREFIASLRDGGTIELELNFLRSTYETMLSDFQSDTVQTYEIVLPDAENTTITFSGLVTDMPLDIAMDAQIKYTVTIKITGQITVASGT